MSDVVIYTAKDGQVELDVNLANETVWLTLNQMVQLFGRDKSVISRHLSNIFKINELDKNSVVANFATTASDGKTYQVDYYNLDAIISVGYRVNSKEGVQFRKWTSNILKEHLIRGYTDNEKRLNQQGIHELQQTVELLQKTLINHELVNDLGQEAIQIILAYTKAWDLLLAYDEGKLKLPTKGKQTSSKLTYLAALSAIESLKQELRTRNEATELFGKERDGGLDSILNNIEQTFDSEPLYGTPEEKAAHLLYFIIKDHPFTDGNKRIGSFMFLLYLKSQNLPIKFNENGLVALALLVAESNPSQKDILIRLVVNLLIDKPY
ncbi:Virulence protein [Legionella beliardensis]|uniref:Virulence protein n=1 Tax=Legionella beliardensis TaxID=91822 RepID=A0A378I3P4_9GAMM|nr:virulence protein RhuM/Fic/DOC family protein [Legionella beliardensis]STX29788.1 Virulence protein [Legionella beliardensis]